MTRRYTRYGLCALAILFVAIYLFPLYWMYVTAMKSGTEIFANPPTFWPRDLHWQVGEIWTRLQMDTYLKNSLIIAAGQRATPWPDSAAARSRLKSSNVGPVSGWSSRSPARASQPAQPDMSVS